MFNRLKMNVKKEVANAKNFWLQSASSTSCGLWKAVSEIRNKRSDSNLSSLLSSFISFSNVADSINQAFCENFSPSPDWLAILDNITEPNEEDCNSWNVSLNVNDVYAELTRLQLKKAAGSNGLPPRLLVAGAEIFAPIITHLIAL